MKINFSEEINRIIEAEFDEKVTNIIPCGNHELKRNMVFQIDTLQAKRIIKFFYKPIKRDRELNALKHIKNNPLQILKIGETTDGIDWLIYNFIDGKLLEEVYWNLDEKELQRIFYEIGIQMAKIHQSVTFDYFGDWEKEFQIKLTDYKTFMVNDSKRVIENIRSQNLPGRNTLELCIAILESEYDNICDIEEARICHRDLDGRNIIVDRKKNGHYTLKAILDYEKCIPYNADFDIIGLYRKYFVFRPQLIPFFFKGYSEVLHVNPTFNKTLRFNLFRLGLHICSWSKDFSEDYYFEVLTYLKQLLWIDEHHRYHELYYKKYE